MVKKNSYIKCKSIDQCILIGKIYWSTQTKHHLEPWDPLESDHLQTSPYLHLFSYPIYFIYKLLKWKLVVKIKLILFQTFYLILIEYICRPPSWREREQKNILFFRGVGEIGSDGEDGKQREI